MVANNRRRAGDPRGSGGFAHSALFYRGPRQYRAGVGSFILDGLAAGTAVAVAVPEANQAMLRPALGPAADQVEWIDMAVHGRNPGRILPGVLLKFANRHPGRQVRIVGEPIWPGRDHQEYTACVLHEALINLAFAGRRVDLQCPYDAAGLADAVLEDAHGTHPLIDDGSGVRHSDGYDPHRMRAAYNTLPPDPPEHAVTLDFDLHSLVEVRALSRAQAAAAGLDSEQIDDFTLITVELASNSVQHGGGQGTLSLWREPGRAYCQVRDAGTVIDPLAGRVPAPPDQLGGRGLLLVNELADLVRMYTGDDGTVVAACVGVG